MREQPIQGGAVLRELDDIDKAVYAAVAETPTPALDEPIRRLSNAANFSKLWIATAACLAAVGGRRSRRGAVTGLVAVGVTSAVVNQGIKRRYPRARPDRAGEQVLEARHVRMPTSTSFPSGHSASGFAFAVGVGSQLPVVGVVLNFLAAAVAYSRVHTGVHYPGDVVIGSLVGAGIGGIVASMGRAGSTSIGGSTSPCRPSTP
ncbi:MAG: phosphatase PAP2 family protein [Actinomycetia bacterium]|nr:phosphatase PAP2 family protein [Actinomycetes bacterium]MCH9759493.1 phosphatase PAP2 family protein [Actinomycetes bacterium]